MIVGRITDGAGYLFNDNRASHNGLQEADILGCNHCQKLLIKSEWTQDGAFCGSCCQPICGECGDRMLLPLDKGGGCIPFIKKVEEQVERNYHRKQNEKILGI